MHHDQKKNKENISQQVEGLETNVNLARVKNKMTQSKENMTFECKMQPKSLAQKLGFLIDLKASITDCKGSKDKLAPTCKLTKIPPTATNFETDSQYMILKLKNKISLTFTI